MTVNDLDKGWRKFADDLSVDGEAVPLDRVVDRHRATFQAAREAGLRWSSIARLVGKAGAARADGRPISADQLRLRSRVRFAPSARPARYFRNRRH